MVFQENIPQFNLNDFQLPNECLFDDDKRKNRRKTPKIQENSLDSYLQELLDVYGRNV